MAKEKKKSRLLQNPSCATICIVSGGTESSVVNNRTRARVFHYETISHVISVKTAQSLGITLVLQPPKWRIVGEKCSESIITEPKCVTAFHPTLIFIFSWEY